ncbi:hypothetical protein J6590_049166 [Homalodisca vitripennis]|nr:hypothetical protein J6590_049166 [Homalodisca vitripennis]
MSAKAASVTAPLSPRHAAAAQRHGRVHCSSGPAAYTDNSVTPYSGMSRYDVTSPPRMCSLSLAFCMYCAVLPGSCAMMLPGPSRAGTRYSIGKQTGGPDYHRLPAGEGLPPFRVTERLQPSTAYYQGSNTIQLSHLGISLIPGFVHKPFAIHPFEYRGLLRLTLPGLHTLPVSRTPKHPNHYVCLSLSLRIPIVLRNV